MTDNPLLNQSIQAIADNLNNMELNPPLSSTASRGYSAMLLVSLRFLQFCIQGAIAGVIGTILFFSSQAGAILAILFLAVPTFTHLFELCWWPNTEIRKRLQFKLDIIFATLFVPLSLICLTLMLNSGLCKNIGSTYGIEEGEMLSNTFCILGISMSGIG